MAALAAGVYLIPSMKNIRHTDARPNLWVRLKATQEVGKVAYRTEVFDLVIYEVLLTDGHRVEVAAGDTEPATIQEMLNFMALRPDLVGACHSSD